MTVEERLKNTYSSARKYVLLPRVRAYARTHTLHYTNTIQSYVILLYMKCYTLYTPVRTVFPKPP